jgi:hypothetical protein
MHFIVELLVPDVEIAAKTNWKRISQTEPRCRGENGGCMPQRDGNSWRWKAAKNDF